MWDLVSGGRQLFRLSPHNKTVTCLGFANGQRRVVTASLDGHVKFHDVATLATVHQIKFPSPILSAAVAVRTFSYLMCIVYLNRLMDVSPLFSLMIALSWLA